MVYAVIMTDQERQAVLFDTWEDYHKSTFSPYSEVDYTIELGRLQGKTYQERKEDIRNKAIEYSNNIVGGLFMSDLAQIGEYFERYGKRYGLLTEFKENGIC